MIVIPRIGLTSLVVTAVAVTRTPLFAADSADARWEPGHETTAALAGEVQPDERHDTSDGVYGRFDGDLDIGLHGGAELEDGSARLLASASAHFYWTAGIYGSYREATGAGRDDLDAVRVGSVGIDLRPLFIPRWSLDWSSGPATLDLLIDSLSVSGGAFFSGRTREAEGTSSTRAQRRGFELGFGLGLPLAGGASGPWLGARYDLRWPDSGDRTDSVWLTLSWHFLVATPLSSSTAEVW